MKRERHLTVFLLICTLTMSSGLYGQKRGHTISKDIDVLFGPVYKQTALNTFIRNLKADETGMTLLRQRVNVTSIADPIILYLERFNANMEHESSHEIKIQGVGKQYIFQDMFYAGGRYYLLLYDYNKETDISALYVTTVNETGELTSSLVKISEVSLERRMFGAFKLYFSADGSKLAIKKLVKDPEKKELFGLAVYHVSFRESLKIDLLWEREIRLPYRDKKYDITKVLMANDGNIHMLSQVFLEREDRVKGMPAYYFEVFSYFYEIDEINQYPISLGENYIADISFLSNNPNNLAGSGLYKENKDDRVKGFFYFQIDIPSRRVEKLTQQAFPEEFVKAFLTERQIKKGVSDLSDFSTRLFIANPSGGGIVIAEYYKFSMTHTYTGGTAGITSDWRYEDLIVCRINPDGTFAWLKKIPKKQRSVHDTGVWNNLSAAPIYIGIEVMLRGDQIFIIYNENPDNFNETDPSKMKYMADPRRAVTSLITIDHAGNFTKAPLFPSRSQKTVVMPDIRAFLNANTFVLTARKRKKYNFVKVTLKGETIAYQGK